jgi:flavin-dependent dehydrogenase
MARQGYSTLICDASPEAEIGIRYDIVHIGKEQFRRFGLREPVPGDSEYAGTISRNILRSALDRWPKSIPVETLALRRKPLMRSLAAWAREQGAELLAETEFATPLFDEDGRLTGGTLRHRGAELRLVARLTADASGIGAAVRTKLPKGYGVENFVTGSRDRLYVILQYVKLRLPDKDMADKNLVWPYYKTWISPQADQEEAVMGIGANLSFTNTRIRWTHFLSQVRLPEYGLDRIERSAVPKRRPPYSLVADSFVALGDAACVTCPWTGEGVSSGWLLCSIASEEFGRAMRNGAYPRQEAAWATNRRYNQAQGAAFAQALALMGTALNCRPEENDYEFEHNIIFNEDPLHPGGLLPLKILWAYLKGGISKQTYRNLINALTIGEKLRAHYRAFPASPGQFAAWQKKADKLWEKAEPRDTGVKS